MQLEIPIFKLLKTIILPLFFMDMKLGAYIKERTSTEDVKEQ
jgi:hypothetical protein